MPCRKGAPFCEGLCGCCGVSTLLVLRTSRLIWMEGNVRIGTKTKRRILIVANKPSSKAAAEEELLRFSFYGEIMYSIGCSSSKKSKEHIAQC